MPKDKLLRLVVEPFVFRTGIETQRKRACRASCFGQASLSQGQNRKREHGKHRAGKSGPLSIVLERARRLAPFPSPL